MVSAVALCFVCYNFAAFTEPCASRLQWKRVSQMMCDRLKKSFNCSISRRQPRSHKNYCGNCLARDPMLTPHVCNANVFPL